jgi:hypothetical protein
MKLLRKYMKAKSILMKIKFEFNKKQSLKDKSAMTNILQLYKCLKNKFIKSLVKNKLYYR